jgi:hypothetical protein
MQAALLKTVHISFQMYGCQGSGPTATLFYYPPERISTLVNVNVLVIRDYSDVFIKSFSTSHFHYMLNVLTRNYQQSGHYPPSCL